MCLFLTAVMFLSRNIETKLEQKLDEAVQTAQDYGVLVEDPDSDGKRDLLIFNASHNPHPLSHSTCHFQPTIQTSGIIFLVSMEQFGNIDNF
jgi:hypothetical protein